MHEHPSTYMSNGRFVQKTPNNLLRLRILTTFLSPSGLRYLRSLFTMAGGMEASLQRHLVLVLEPPLSRVDAGTTQSTTVCNVFAEELRLRPFALMKEWAQLRGRRREASCEIVQVAFAQAAIGRCFTRALRSARRPCHRQLRHSAAHYDTVNSHDTLQDTEANTDNMT